jgi:hypothetical protein
MPFAGHNALRAIASVDCSACMAVISEVVCAGRPAGDAATCFKSDV